MRLLTNADIASVPDMRGGIAALRTGYDDLVRGDAALVPRIDLYAPTGRDDDYYQWGSMAGACRSYGVVAVRIKSDIASWPAGRTQEKYCVEPGTYSGIILLYSIVNGEPLALLQDGYLQHVRVGAAAGIGVDLMAQSHADSLGLIGSGGMARTYLEAIAEVRALREVRVYSTTPANCERFAAAASSPDDVTLFVTTGTQGLQFAAVGGHVWQQVKDGEVGTPFPTEWFLQDIRD